jgi:ubiquitin carboxyl-terminal hydrolase 25/28
MVNRSIRLKSKDCLSELLNLCSHFFSSLFYGQTRSYISTGKGTRSKDERWCDIKVDVAGGSRDIYAAIDGAFDAQKISVENTEAEQFGSITRLPPILQIQVQRVQFDPVKKSSFKSTHHLDLLENIYMDRYMDTSKPEIVNRRRQCWEWKHALKSLEARRSELLRKQVCPKALIKQHYKLNHGKLTHA